MECLEFKVDNLKAVYVGETRRNEYDQGMEHMDGVEKEKVDNPSWKHCAIQHDDNKVKFKITSLKSFKTAFM